MNVSGHAALVRSLRPQEIVLKNALQTPYSHKICNHCWPSILAVVFVYTLATTEYMYNLVGERTAQWVCLSIDQEANQSAPNIP